MIISKLFNRIEVKKFMWKTSHNYNIIIILKIFLAVGTKNPCNLLASTITCWKLTQHCLQEVSIIRENWF